MCSELIRIPYELSGVPLFGVGVLLAVWALAAVAILVGMVRRHGWRGEVWGTLPLLLLVGAVIVFLPRAFPDGLPIRGYGLMLLAGIVAGVAMAMYRARQGGLDQELILSLAVWLVVGGVVGARLFYVVQYWEKFAGHSPADTLLEIANIPEGGLVIYGGFFGAVVAFLLFVRNHALPALAMADLVAPSMMIGLALGRIGCLLNGCCYGGHAEWPWAVTFPQYSSRYEAAMPEQQRRYSPPYADQVSRGEMHGFRIESDDAERVVVGRVEAGSPADSAGLRAGDTIAAINGVPNTSASMAQRRLFALFEERQALRLELDTGRTIEIPPITPPPRSRPVHPAQLYAAIDAALLGWLLWAFYPLRRRDGEAIALMLTIHPVTRFLLEMIRTDEPDMFAGMSISQNISIVLLLSAAGLWWYLSRGPRGVVWPLGGESGGRKRGSSPQAGRG